jgi:molecular chaperone GrpE
MTKPKNPWAERASKMEEDHEVQEKGSLHTEEEMIDEELDDEVADLDQAEQAAPTDEAQEKLAQAREQVVRAHAEIENMRRRAEQDVAKAHKFALEKFAKDLLPIIDSLEQALANKTENTPVVEGVEMTLQMFKSTLARFNVEQIDPLNEKFDPKLHEAMSMQPNPDVDPNTVIMVIQKGYTLNGRLIRPARVIVSQ